MEPKKKDWTDTWSKRVSLATGVVILLNQLLALLEKLGLS